MSYDDPNAVHRREVCLGPTTAGNGTVGGKFALFQKHRIDAAHAVVVTAGTSAGHTVTLKNGTNALGTFTLGTVAAGGTVDITGLGTLTGGVTNPMDQLSLTNGTDATGVAMVVVELQQTPDAARSAY